MDLDPPVRESAVVHQIVADGPFGAWAVGMGGYKAHGLAAARSHPGAAPPALFRGTEPDALSFLAETTGTHYEDGDPGQRFFYRINRDVSLLVSRCGPVICLDW